MRTISNIETLLILLDNTIRSILLPALLNGYSCSDMERNLISLPAKFGGLGIFKHQERCSVEYANSSKIITFWDTLYLRYNIQLRNLPSHLIVCVVKLLLLSMFSRVQKVDSLTLDTMSYKILQLNYLMNATQM